MTNPKRRLKILQFPHVLNRLVVGKYQKTPSLSQRDVQGVHTIWNVLVFDFEGNLQRGLCSFILGIFHSLHPCNMSMEICILNSTASSVFRILCCLGVFLYMY